LGFVLEMSFDYLLFTNSFRPFILGQELIDKVLDIGSVSAEYATCTATRVVKTEGGDPGDDIGIEHEIGAARIAKARTAGIRVV
jgi:hypothetical protein